MKLTTIFVKDSDKKSQVSEGEIMEMAHLGLKEGSLNHYESSLIQKVFNMNDIAAYDIMVPKNDVEIIEVTSSYDEIIETVDKTGITRFPIIGTDNEIIGIINAKDLFKFYQKVEKFSIQKILRPAVYIPESMKIFSVEKKLKTERTHIAIIVNEHGDFTGIITLEDIIEELHGEIEDEFDKNEKQIHKISDSKYVVDASIYIDDLNERLKLDINNEDEDFTTLNGYLAFMLDKMPKVNDTYKIPKAKFRIIKATKKKILQVEILLKN